jgi:hypothetical protein
MIFRHDNLFVVWYKVSPKNRNAYGLKIDRNINKITWFKLNFYVNPSSGCCRILLSGNKKRD